MTEHADPHRYVDYGKLTRAADGAANTARSLRKHTDDLAEGCVSATAGHEAWGWSGALAKLHAACYDHVHGHANDIHGIGDHLIETHDNYKRGEKGAGDDVTWLSGTAPFQEL